AGERVHPDQISQRGGTAALDVDDVLLPAILLHDEGAEDAQWWCAVQRVARQQREKALIAAGPGSDQLMQLFDKVRLTTDRFQIEEDIAVEQGLGIGALDP